MQQLSNAQPENAPSLYLPKATKNQKDNQTVSFWLITGMISSYQTRHLSRQTYRHTYDGKQDSWRY